MPFSRIGDVLIASSLLLVTLPLLIAVGLAIKLESSGPVLERQSRIGPRGRRFYALKFRTRQYRPAQSTPVWARQATRLGQLLRYTRIEALPQLINVLRGEMTIIDPHRNLPFFLD